MLTDPAAAVKRRFQGKQYRLPASRRSAIVPPTASSQPDKATAFTRVARVSPWVSTSALALAGFEAAVGLVDDIDATLAAHDAIVAMAATQGLQRIAHFHGRLPLCSSGFRAGPRLPFSIQHAQALPGTQKTRPGRSGSPKRPDGVKLVGATGIEPVTPTMSR